MIVGVQEIYQQATKWWFFALRPQDPITWIQRKTLIWY